MDGQEACNVRPLTLLLSGGDTFFVLFRSFERGNNRNDMLCRYVCLGLSYSRAELKGSIVALVSKDFISILKMIMNCN